MYHPRFKGNHYVMGQKMGSIFIKCNAQFPIKLDPFQTEFGRESGKLLKQFFPEATEEIKGITDVMGIDNELFISSFINREEGINQYGLVVAMTFVMPKLEEIKPGINSVFLVRYLLENCKTVDEGVDALKKLPITSIWSSVFDISNHKIYRAEGNPSRKKYQEDVRLGRVIIRNGSGKDRQAVKAD
jgi:hypothetical protein